MRKIINLINQYWRFDNDQDHISTWHDKQDLINEIEQCTIPFVVDSITCGEVDDKGYVDTYVNGKKTNVRLLLWDKQRVERLQEIGKKLQEEMNKK